MKDISFKLTKHSIFWAEKEEIHISYNLVTFMTPDIIFILVHKRTHIKLMSSVMDLYTWLPEIKFPKVEA